MRVLVTGATGFVGRYLCDLLVARHHEVWGTFLQRDTLDESAGLRLVQCDLRDFSAVQGAVQEARPQQVYHLAAMSSVRDSFDDAQSVYQANFWGTLNLLEAIRSLQPSARVLLVGSAHVYGRVKRAKLPISEQQLLAPDSPYGVSKAAADLLGYQFFQAYDMHVVRARPFNHTGPGQSTHFVCSDFARQFAAIDLNLAQPIVRVGNIRASRDFSDVRDVVRAYELLMRKASPGEAYNVASGRAVPLSRILDILQSFTTRKILVNVEQNRVRSGESDVFYGSNRKLKQATGWSARFDLETTLHNLYAYWKNALKQGLQP
jgi:GDP-4-dehydro-6-deoxy-D-mannose reductase